MLYIFLENLLLQYKQQRDGLKSYTPTEEQVKSGTAAKIAELKTRINRKITELTNIGNKKEWETWTVSKQETWEIQEQTVYNKLVNDIRSTKLVPIQKLQGTYTAPIKSSIPTNQSIIQQVGKNTFSVSQPELPASIASTGLTPPTPPQPPRSAGAESSFPEDTPTPSPTPPAPGPVPPAPSALPPGPPPPVPPAPSVAPEPVPPTPTPTPAVRSKEDIYKDLGKIHESESIIKNALRDGDINQFRDILPKSIMSGGLATLGGAQEFSSSRQKLGKFQELGESLTAENEVILKEKQDFLKGFGITDENSLNTVREDIVKKLKEAVDANNSAEESALRGRLKDLDEGLQTFKTRLDENSDAIEENTKKTLEEVVKPLKVFSDTLEKVSDAMLAFVTEIRSIQQQFGIDAGQAASLATRDFGQSLGSMAGALTGQEAFVTREQIQQGRSAFQGEFGGLISPDEARAVAQRSAQEGITAQQQAMARRVFITESRGDVGGAERREAQFLEQFKNANLTAKDAMEAIGKNAELLYRNGDRFRDSITKAAIEAKKIGVDLSSIERFGDNLINNFEGFLEGQAELGAMGFGFDTSRLSEIAAGGDTGALMEELQSQLASTGKNLDTLDRPQRLALESAFGMTIGEIKKLTSGEGGSGKSMEDLQELGNKSLTTIVNLMSGWGVALSGIAAVLAGAHMLALYGILANTAVTAQMTTMQAIKSGLGSMVPVMGRLGMGAAGAAAAGIGTVGGGMLGTSMGASPQAAGIGSTIGTVVGGLAGFALGGPMGAYAGMAAGGAIGGGIAGMVSGDDVVSKPGYGDRILLHQNQPPIALNDLDTVVAYADDMVSSESGVKLLSKGDAAPSLDISPLEAKLDAVVQTIQQMSQQTAASHDRLAGALAQRKSVYLNGNQVGYEMAENETSAAITAPFRVARTNRG